MRRPGAIRRLLRRLPSGVLNSELVIGHTRLATSGTPKNNENNHPFAGTRWLIVHNGFVFNSRKFDRRGDCDSEAILSVLESNNGSPAKDAIGRVAEELTGIFACAAIDKHDPCHVYLWRDDNPIWLGILSNCTVFASEARLIKEAYPKAHLLSLPQDKVARVGRHGITHVWPLPESPDTGAWWHKYDPDFDEGDDPYDYRRVDERLVDETVQRLLPGGRVYNFKTERWERSGGGEIPREITIKGDTIAWYTDYTFEVYCTACIKYLGRIGMSPEHLSPILSEKHWVLTEVNKECVSCGDPVV